MWLENFIREDVWGSSIFFSYVQPTTFLHQSLCPRCPSHATSAPAAIRSQGFCFSPANAATIRITHLRPSNEPSVFLRSPSTRRNDGWVGAASPPGIFWIRKIYTESGEMIGVLFLFAPPFGLILPDPKPFRRRLLSLIIGVSFFLFAPPYLV